MRKTSDLILERQVGQHRGQVARRAVAHHVAQPREVALANDRGELVGGARRVAHALQRRVAVRAVELLFHMGQCRSHDVAMVHVRADGLGGVEPEPVNEIEVFGLEGGRVRAEVIRGGAAARMVDDEADVDAARVRRALPRVAEQPRLLVGRQRLRFADVNLRRAEPQRRLDDGVEDVDAGHDQQAHRPRFALGQRDHRRQQPALVVGRPRHRPTDRRARRRRRAARS